MLKRPNVTIFAKVDIFPFLCLIVCLCMSRDVDRMGACLNVCIMPICMYILTSPFIRLSEIAVTIEYETQIS